MARGGAVAAELERERGRERERRGANGSGDTGGRCRVLLVADRGASSCRMLATLRPSSAGAPRRHSAAVRARARRGRGEGGERGRAGPASASGPEVRPRPPSAPLSFFYFFLKFFSQIFF